MSRVIDVSDLENLSKDDVQYLRDRGTLTAAQEASLGNEDADVASPPDPNAPPRPQKPEEAADDDTETPKQRRRSS